MKTLLMTLAIASTVVLHAAAEEKSDPPPAGEPTPISIANLDPKLADKQVTVKFTVSGLDGIAQLLKPGETPWFAIETKSEQEKKSLTVWIESELANVLDRLQMSYLQPHQLQPGAVIVATGKLRVSQDRERGDFYTLHVNAWQKFRIVTPEEAD